MTMTDIDAVTLSDAALYSGHRDGATPERLRKMTEQLKAAGFSYVRAKRVEGGWWMEGWVKQPTSPADFNLVHVTKVKREFVP